MSAAVSGDKTEAEALMFEIGATTYAVDTRKIREVVGYSEVTPAPIDSDFLFGVINLHGDLVPVVNAHQILSEKAAPFRTGDPLIVINWHRESVALKADRMLEVKPYASAKSGQKENYALGKFEVGGREVYILDTEKLFSFLATALSQGFSSLEA